MIIIPFANYENFNDCISKNQDKKDPAAYCAAIKQQVEGKSLTQNYSFMTDQVAYETVETKGEKKFFVTGYISTGDVDLYNDLVTPSAMQSMLKQIKESTITLDYDHEAWRDSPTILPVGKIVQAKIDERGLWVKAELNPSSPKFNDMWNSIKDGFIKAFSIAFKPLKTVMKKIGDTRVRLIEDLTLLNIALTGVPVNQGAVLEDYTMKGIMLKAITEIGENEITKEVRNMVEDNLKSSVGLKAEEEEEEVESKDYKRGYKAGMEAQKEKEAEKKAESKEEKEEKLEQKSINKFLADLKALTSKVEAQEAELRTMKDKGVFKSKASDYADMKSQEKLPTMLGLIR